MPSSDTPSPGTEIDVTSALPTDGSAAFRSISAGSGPFASRFGDLEFARSLLIAASLPGEQEPSRQEILRFCEQHPDALFRSCVTGHLTASAFVVDPATRAVALIHHRKLDRWLQPGGHADGEGNLALVAATEVAEEIGLDDLTFVMPAFDIDIHAIPPRRDDPRHLHLDLRFLALATAGTELRPNEETLGADWVEAHDERLDRTTDVAVAARRAIELAGRLTSV